MNYKSAHKKALEHMHDNCNSCIHAFECDKVMNEAHALRWFMELDENNVHRCRICPQYRHGASCDRKAFIAWSEYAE